MDAFHRHRIEKINNNNEFALVIYLDDYQTEFANELGTRTDKRRNILDAAKNIVHNQYPKLKVTMVKVVLGGMVITSFQIAEKPASAEAAANNEPISEQVKSTLYYQVANGDTLWSLSQKFHTTVQNIKQVNKLTSDSLLVNQKLIIPKALHTVKTGDYLSVLARDYDTTVWSIRAANNLSSDNVILGQTLIIPLDVSTGMTPSPSTAAVNAYTVTSNDTLYSVSKRFGVTIEALRSTNQLTTDLIKVGQVLKIPNGATANEPVLPKEAAPASELQNEITKSHTVDTDETLWGIAAKYGITVALLKETNNLKSDIIQPGQVLTIPTKSYVSPSTATTPSTQVVDRKTFTYRIVAGDTLSTIASRFGVTVTAIKAENQLTTDLLQVGQALTIPNGTNAPQNAGYNTITYKTHTVSSGDNIWNLSVQYGIPQGELLRVNNLTTSSLLSIGQKLKIPIHNIAVKETVSSKHGELLDWWTEAQYIFTIGKQAKVTDLATGKSFFIKRTVGANHADSETVTLNDTNIAKSIWGGFSWKTRAVILEVDGRKLAASMSFMPHEREYISGNGITGHFDVYFSNSTRHVDGKSDPLHQAQVEIAAGLR